MRLQEEARGEHSLLRVSGAATRGPTCEALSGALLRAESERSGNVLLEAHELTQLDSTALGVLVGAVRRLNGSGRELILVNPDRRIRVLLELTRLSGLFPSYPTVEAAVAAHDRRSKGDASLGDRNRRDL
ncbi:MAG: STAS domain-containing protein [Acidobacteriota bacterium]|nr:STAS domain-containing protein [Acidobacteriota bacterium]